MNILLRICVGMSLHCMQSIGSKEASFDSFIYVKYCHQCCSTSMVSVGDLVPGVPGSTPSRGDFGGVPFGKEHFVV